MSGLEERELTGRQLTAIKAQREIADGVGPDLAASMVAMYRRGFTKHAIAEALLPHEIGRSHRVAASAVGIVLRNCMDLDEFERIGHEIRIRLGEQVGALSAAGIHGFAAMPTREVKEISARGRAAVLDRLESGELDSEVFVDAGRRGGQKAAETHRANGTGVFGMSDAERSRIGRQNGTKLRDEGRGIFAPEHRDPEILRARAANMLAKTGKKLMSGDEKARLMELAAELIRVGGVRSGTPDYEEIQLILKEEFGIERTLVALRNVVYRERKKARMSSGQ